MSCSPKQPRVASRLGHLKRGQVSISCLVKPQSPANLQVDGREAGAEVKNTEDESVLAPHRQVRSTGIASYGGTLSSQNEQLVHLRTWVRTDARER